MVIMNRRIPILLWGDLVRGSKPVLRRVLIGSEAHDAMYLFVYLQEQIALNELKDLLRTSTNEIFFPRDIMDQGVFDRTNSLNRENFFNAAKIYSNLSSSFNTIYELGSTYGATQTKLEILSNELMKKGIKIPQIKFVGIENSILANKVSKLFSNFQIFSSLEDINLDQAVNNIFYSRFVSSYYFLDSQSFLNEIKKFDQIFIEDAFSLTNSDVEVWNHGLRQTYFDSRKVVEGLKSSGYNVQLLDFYIDFPAKTAPCRVVKIFASKDESYNNYAQALNFDFKNLDIISLESKISSWALRRIKRYKFFYPIWARTKLPLEKKPVRKKFRSIYYLLLFGGFRFNRHQLLEKIEEELNFKNN